LKQSQVRKEDVVKVDLWVFPGDVHFHWLVETTQFTVDDGHVDDVAVDVDTWPKPAAKQVDAHDAEDQPEDQADQKNVEDRWNRLD